ncbi:MAG TPA: hypothetical protein VK524_15585 [Polyangiaceae bacterium]|nr:hypothetical protein [Polyangiaceae bacterium]
MHDPRWDRQVEARDTFYAQLMIATGTNIDALGRYIAQARHEADESDYWLPMGVLAEMSRRGALAARDTMAEAVKNGSRWRACLDALEAAGGADLLGQIVSAETVQALVARVAIDDIADAVTVVGAPWERWAERVPALRFVVRNGAGGIRESRAMSGPVAWTASRIRKPEMPGDLTGLSTKSLLARCSTPGAVSELSYELARRTDSETRRLLASTAELGGAEERHVALRALGKQGSTNFVAAAEEFLRKESTLPSSERREHRLRQGFLRYLEELPPAVTLPLARRWFCESWPLSLAAEHVLARYATPDDRPMLEDAGDAALASSDMYRLCSIVDAIGAAGPDDSLRFLSEVYEQAPYSYARRRVVSAMSRCSLVGATESYLTEALWDCEPESRELACRAAGQAMGVPLARINEMASDVYESDRVREAARSVVANK